MTTTNKKALYLSRERTWPRPGLTSKLKDFRKPAQERSNACPRQISAKSPWGCEIDNTWNKLHTSLTVDLLITSSIFSPFGLATRSKHKHKHIILEPFLFFSSLWMVIYQLIQMHVLVSGMHVECVAAPFVSLSFSVFSLISFGLGVCWCPSMWCWVCIDACMVVVALFIKLGESLFRHRKPIL